jgi:hypothetical protein
MARVHHAIETRNVRATKVATVHDAASVTDHSVKKLTNEESGALARPRADEDGRAGASAVGHCQICTRALAVAGGQIL